MTAITAPNTPNTEKSEQAKGWRDELPIHPAAELFPPMSKDELKELAADIDAHGLQERVDLYRNRETQGYEVLDGRNRLDALEILGPLDRALLSLPNKVFHRIEDDGSFNPYAYVVSKNLHRRHLTVEQKKEIVAKLLAANTVAAVRAEGEATGEIPQLEKTKGKDGKARPARKQPAPAVTFGTPCDKRKRVVFSEEEVNPKAEQKVFDSPQEAHAAPTKAIEAMRAAWREVELHAEANNNTMLKAPIGNLITKATGALKAIGGLQ